MAASRQQGTTGIDTIPRDPQEAVATFGSAHPPDTVCRDDSSAAIRYAKSVIYVNRAWELAGERYVDDAILKRVGTDFTQLVKAFLPSLLIALGFVVGTTGVFALVGGAIGALGGGVGAAPGALAGGELGLTIATWILDWLGIAFLVVYLGSAVAEIGAYFFRGIKIAWESCGAAIEIDSAAHEMADGVGEFFSILLQALAAFVATEGLAAAKIKLAKSDRFLSLQEYVKSRGFLEGPWVSYWLRILGRPKEPDLVRSRIATALQFFEDKMPTLPWKDKKGFLEGMDFNTPKGSFTGDFGAKPDILKAGEEVIAYRDPSRDPLRLFYAKVGSSPNKLGIDADGYKFFRFRVKADVEVLRCRTTGVEAYNTGALVPGESTQYIIPDASRYLEVISEGQREPLGPAIRKITKP